MILRIYYESSLLSKEDLCQLPRDSSRGQSSRYL